MKAGLILSNANVYTMDPDFPRAEAVAIWKDKIYQVTRDQNIKDFKDSKTQIIDCRNRAVLPGFIDAHGHLVALAENRLFPSVSASYGIHSIVDIQNILAERIQGLPAGRWVRASGYSEFSLQEKRHPNRWDLDKISCQHPIKLTHRSGHAHVLNSLALRLANISSETPDPPGGLIDRDVNTGEPSGLLFAMGNFLAERIPPLDDSEISTGIELANQELLSCGITSIQDLSPRNNLERWNLFQQWKISGRFLPRISMMVGKEGFQEYQKENFPNRMPINQLRLGGVKIIIDETTGRLNPSQEELNDLVFQIHQIGFQVALHAVEETAIKAACLAIELAVKKSPRRDHRHRIEHCSVCPPFLSKRLAFLGITVVTQPAFVYSQGERYLRTVAPHQLEYLYPIATLIRDQVPVAGGSDLPIGPTNPMIGIYAASSRLAETGEPVLPEERISPLEALRLFTRNAARTSFEESIKGSITPGKMADLVVLSNDPAKVPPNELKDIKVEMTILDGKIVWQASA
jgi:predicted amidohydrolase YtcJ